MNPVIRLKAIRHYLHEKRADTFTFMSLWNDEEPYTLNELIQVQQSYIEGLKNEVGDMRKAWDFIHFQINSEEITLKKLQTLRISQKNRQAQAR